MAIIRPFRALRYNERKAGPLAGLVAPPYDVIDQADQERLYAQSPHNCVRLVLNRDSERYASSARCFASWISQGILRLDPRPAIYLYSVRFRLPPGILLADRRDGEYERVGLIAALQLEEYHTGVVRPHERTFSGPKIDRLELLRTCRANLSPIFGLVSKDSLPFRDLMPATAPAASVDLGGQGLHRLWSLEDDDVVGGAIAALRDEPVLIADGHHRYETALRYRADRAREDPQGAGPADYIMAFLANMDEPGLVVLPTHRLLKHGGASTAELKAALCQWAEVEELDGTDTGFELVKHRLAAAEPERCVIGIVGERGRKLLLAQASWDSVPAGDDLPEPLRKLEVTALHRAVLPAASGPASHRGAQAQDIAFDKDADRARARVASGEAAFAFLLPPPSLQRLKEVCRSGTTMPEKSTYFFPKLLTGLAFRSVDRGREQ